MTDTPKRNKTTAVIAFLIMLLFWVVTVTHKTLGFVAPNNAQSVGYDLWTLAIWAVFVYATRNLWRAFQSPRKPRPL